MNTYDYEDALFRTDPKLREFRNLKEIYIQFNSRNAGKPIEARSELDELIPMYQTSEHEIEYSSLGVHAVRWLGNQLAIYPEYKKFHQYKAG